MNQLRISLLKFNVKPQALTASFAILITLISFDLFAEESPDNTGVIRDIKFVRQNVFSKDENPLGLGDPYLNRLHFITRKQIIKQELLLRLVIS